MNFPGRVGQKEIYDDFFIKSLCRKLWPVASAERETIVVAANRCGTHGKHTYAGSSAVLGLGNGFVKIYSVLGRGQRSLLIVDTSVIPTYTWDENKVFQKVVPNPSITHQVICDQQTVQSRLNSNIEAIRTLQDIVREAHAAQQDSLKEIRQLAYMEVSLKPIIKNGMAAGVSDSILSDLVAFQVQIERHLREARVLTEKFENMNKSVNEHYENSLGQLIKFLGSVELVGIENVAEETGNGK